MRRRSRFFVRCSCLAFLSASASALSGVVGCGGAPAVVPKHLDLPVSPAASVTVAKPPAREAPPPSGEAKASPFPQVRDHALKNGVKVAVVEAHALPIAQIRVVVRAGMGYAPKTPGAAELTAEMLKDGGTRSMTSAEVLRRIEGLGANLSVSVGEDATTVSTAITKDHLAEALAILGEVVQAPRFDEGELGKLKKRASDEAEEHLRGSGQFTATRAMFHALFPAESPYASYGLVPSDIAKVNGATIRDFYRRFYVPKSTTVVLVGDVDDAAGAAMVDKVFAGWVGAEPPKVDFPAPSAPAATRVIVAHRPKSAQSDVFVAGLGVPRSAPDWPLARVSNQVLGGGVAGRLFSDVREQRSLAYSVYSRIIELSHGDQPVVAYAGTQTDKTADAVQGLLENLQKMAQGGAGGATDAETATARRYLSDVFAIRMETIGSIADMVAELVNLGLPYDYWDRYRDAVRAATPSGVAEVAPKLFHPDRALIVVAGDADVIAPKLARFGQVTVVDPEKDFSTVKTLPAEGSK
jgi:zinc protease